MYKAILGAVAGAFLFAAPALAGHCPKDVAKIDEALSGNHGLGEAQLTQVKALRDQGQQLHQAGQHGESLEALHQALEILGMPH